MSDAQIKEPRETNKKPRATTVINGIAGLPICAVGVAMLLALNYMGGDEALRTPWFVVPLWLVWLVVALAVVALGAFVEVIGIALVMKYSTPELDPVCGEEILKERNPSNVPAYFWMLLGAFLFAPAIVILPFLEASYEAAAIAVLWVAVSAFVYLRGTVSFWKNQHTVYYATNFRVVRMYQFLRVDTLSMPIERINSVHVALSPFERPTGRGDVSVYAGRRVMRIRGIDEPRKMAESILEQLGRNRS